MIIRFTTDKNECSICKLVRAKNSLQRNDRKEGIFISGIMDKVGGLSVCSSTGLSVN